MTIPATISTALTSLEAQVTAATPLTAASHATVLALQLNAAALVTSIQGTLTASSLLDTWTAPSDPTAIVQGILQVSGVAQDANTLALLRGLVGRANNNLEQL